MPIVSTAVAPNSSRGLNKLAWDRREGRKAAIGSSDGKVYVYEISQGTIFISQAFGLVTNSDFWCRPRDAARDRVGAVARDAQRRRGPEWALRRLARDGADSHFIPSRPSLVKVPYVAASTPAYPARACALIVPLRSPRTTRPRRSNPPSRCIGVAEELIFSVHSCTQRRCQRFPSDSRPRRPHPSPLPLQLARDRPTRASLAPE